MPGRVFNCKIMIKYFKDSIKEIQKVTWPKKEQALNLTVVTIIFTIVTTLGLTLVDRVFNAGYQALLDLSPTTIETEAPQVDVSDVDFAPITIEEGADSEEVPTDDDSAETPAEESATE
jgi:preprotein translocase SecE subunit